MSRLSSMGRREFVKTAAGVTLGMGFGRVHAASSRKFTMDLVCGAIGIRADQIQAIELASRFGFESVGVDSGYLAGIPSEKRREVAALLKEKGLVFGAAGLSVEFRKDEQRFTEGLTRLRTEAAALEDAGVTRLGTWIMPNHAELTYLANFKQHSSRLREVSKILADHGVRFGLEYVGPRTSWTASKYSFVHTLAEARELISAIGVQNVGLVLDSWHWYTAEETEADLLSLKNGEIVAVDLNDAPEGIPVEEQMDLTRRLPSATGVIDLKLFLTTLLKIGYDGPIRAEPFDASLREMPAEEAVAKTAAAMKKAFALVA